MFMKYWWGSCQKMTFHFQICRPYLKTTRPKCFMKLPPSYLT
nr:MAG TPA: hypothetical protein [Caudoviricetes sp.]